VSAAQPDPGLRITCQEVVELITDYLEGVLDADQAAEVETHLGLCEGCEVYLEQMRATIQSLGAVTTETLSETAQAELLNAFRNRAQRSSGS
jgi:anti-sigma factor RsiW